MKSATLPPSTVTSADAPATDLHRTYTLADIAEIKHIRDCSNRLVNGRFNPQTDVVETPCAACATPLSEAELLKRWGYGICDPCEKKVKDYDKFQLERQLSSPATRPVNGTAALPHHQPSVLAKSSKKSLRF